jgi:tRNA threonylcarbamoyladenosine biosynthesis protein TsaB
MNVYNSSMKILAIETSTMLGGAAVADENGILAEIRLNVKTTHSERLMSAVDHILKQADTGLDQISVFCAASGPGSFTGLRIGLGTVKGLCYATGKPLVMVPTLDAFAWNFAYSSHPVCLMLDARKGEVYTAAYKWHEDGFEKIITESAMKVEDICSSFDGPVVLAGEGVSIYRERILSLLGERAIIAPPEKMVPSPACTAVLGLGRALRQDFVDPYAAEPFYMRKSEAELKFRQGH